MDTETPYQWIHGRCKKKALLKSVQAEQENENFVYEVKEDGHRYWLQIRPKKIGHNCLLTRHVSKQTGLLTDKSHKLVKMRDFDFGSDFSDSILDGEVVAETGTSLSSDVQHEIAQGKGVFKCWDIVMDSGEDLRDLPYHIRRERLEKFFQDLRDAERLPSWLILSRTWYNPKKALDYVLQNKLEGLVKKNIDAKYGVDWTKLINVETFDCIIYDYEPTKSADWAEKGWIGAIRFGQWRKCNLGNTRMRNGDTFTVGDRRMFDNKSYQFVHVGRCSGMTQKLRAEISANKEKWLGTIIEVKSKERLRSGALRNPRFSRVRRDKNVWECMI